MILHSTWRLELIKNTMTPMMHVNATSQNNGVTVLQTHKQTHTSPIYTPEIC